MHTQTLYSAPLEIKLAPTSDEVSLGLFSGYASTFGYIPDSHKDIIAPGAFTKSLARRNQDYATPAMLWMHDSKKPIGRWLSFKEDDYGLYVSGKLTLDVPQAQEAYALMKDGALAMSIGFFLIDSVQLTPEIRQIKEVELVEVSLVSLPSNSRAQITEVKALDLDDPRAFERRVRDALGLSSRQAKRLMSGGWSALVRDERSDNSTELVAIAKRLHQITQDLRTK